MIYEVIKGSHYFSPKKIKFFIGNKLKKQIKFTKSCLYQDKPFINKLFGFSRGYHHHNSVRFGWRPTDHNKIELLAYMYINGKRIKEEEQDIHLAFIDISNYYNLEINNLHNKVIFKIFDIHNQLITIREFPFTSKFKLGYHLNPYFGGKPKAPHNMYIHIKDL
jgi:hypothetical protein